MAGTRKSLSDFFVPNAYDEGHFTELEESNAVVLNAGPMRHSRSGPIRSNHDVESGRHGFPVRDTFGDEARFDSSA